MKTTLRDSFLKNIDISEGALEKINDKLIEIINAANEKETQDNKKMFPTYILRFDGKGSSFFAFDEALDKYKNANKFERFVFAVDCLQSFQNKMFGKSIAVHLDGYDQNNCKLIVQGDEPGWVDNAFTSLEDVIKKFKNYNFIVRNQMSSFMIQVAGVVIGVLLSIRGAQFLAPKLNIQYALPFAFIIVFLIFSNSWTYLYSILLRCLGRLWPNVTFKEKQSNFRIIVRWCLNVILGFVFLAGVKTIGVWLFNICISLFK